MSDQERSPLAVNYAAQWWAAIVVLAVLGAISLIQTVGPEALGIPPIAFRWLAIVSGVLVIIQGFLPRLQSVPINNYDEVKRAEAREAVPLADQIMALTADERKLLQREVEYRHNLPPVAPMASTTLEEYEARLRPEERERRAGLARWQREALIEHAAEDSRRPTTEIRSHGGEGMAPHG